MTHPGRVTLISNYPHEIAKSPKKPTSSGDFFPKLRIRFF